MASASSRRRGGAADYTWPGYVDALTTLLMVLIFLLSIFSVAQFTLSNVLTTKDTAIDALGRQISSLAEQLNVEKQNVARLQRDGDADGGLAVTQRGTGRDSVALSAGFDYAANATAEVQVDGRKDEFYTAKRSAFARDGKALRIVQ